MGFIFCRVMHFYSMGYKKTLKLPLRTFWLMSSNINRISAEKDIRSLSVAAGSASDKGFKMTSEALRIEMGDVFKKPDEIIAREGINKLKEIASKQKINKQV